MPWRAFLLPCNVEQLSEAEGEGEEGGEVKAAFSSQPCGFCPAGGDKSSHLIVFQIQIIDSLFMSAKYLG